MINEAVAPTRAATVSRREVLIGGTLMTAAVAASVLGRTAQAPVQLGAAKLEIPDVAGPWRRSAAEGVLIPRGEQPEDRTYDDVVTGYYTSTDAPSVMLLIAYGSAQTGTTQLHRPEVCYPAAGFQVRHSRDQLLSLHRARLRARGMTATAVGRTEQILYWSRVGRDFPTSAMDQRWAVLRHAVHGITPDGALVRISIISEDAAEGAPWLRRFAHDLVAASGSEMRRLMVGTS